MGNEQQQHQQELYGHDQKHDFLRARKNEMIHERSHVVRHIKNETDEWQAAYKNMRPAPGIVWNTPALIDMPVLFQRATGKDGVEAMVQHDRESKELMVIYTDASVAQAPFEPPNNIEADFDDSKVKCIPWDEEGYEQFSNNSMGGNVNNNFGVNNNSSMNSNNMMNNNNMNNNDTSNNIMNNINGGNNNNVFDLLQQLPGDQKDFLLSLVSGANNSNNNNGGGGGSGGGGPSVDLLQQILNMANSRQQQQPQQQQLLHPMQQPILQHNPLMASMSLNNLPGAGLLNINTALLNNVNPGLLNNANAGLLNPINLGLLNGANMGLLNPSAPLLGSNMGLLNNIPLMGNINNMNQPFNQQNSNDFQGQYRVCNTTRKCTTQK